MRGQKRQGGKEEKTEDSKAKIEMEVCKEIEMRKRKSVGDSGTVRQMWVKGQKVEKDRRADGKDIDKYERKDRNENNMQRNGIEKAQMEVGQ